MVMGTAQEPHPIVLQLEAIEERLGRIEEALGIKPRSSSLISRRTVVTLGASLMIVVGIMYGVNKVLNDLFSALPV